MYQGDPNVPAGKVSIIVDLRRPMVLTAEQQSNLQLLADMDTSDLPPETDMSQLPRQPYVHNDMMGEDENPKLPEYCTARWVPGGMIKWNVNVFNPW